MTRLTEDEVRALQAVLVKRGFVTPGKIDGMLAGLSPEVLGERPAPAGTASQQLLDLLFWLNGLELEPSPFVHTLRNAWVLTKATANAGQRAVFEKTLVKLGTTLEPTVTVAAPSPVATPTPMISGGNAMRAGRLDLKGKQLEAFRDALWSAFPGWKYLDELVEFELGVTLEGIVERGPGQTVAFELAKWARRYSRLDQLLEGARRQNPTNEDLKRFAYEVTLTSDAPPVLKNEAIILPSVAFSDVAQWRDQMTTLERAVCRIEVRSGGNWVGIGTASLVGSDAVMTNAHVARQVGAEQARAQFDYKVDAAGGVVAGPAIDFAANWLITQHPEHDYAFIRLSAPIDRKVLTASRGAIAPSEPMFILQHPDGDRLKVCVGTVTASTPTLVKYTTNTREGSSGAPCFTASWELVALHRAAVDGQSVNAGTPITAVLDGLAAVSRPELLTVSPAPGEAHG